MNDHSQSLEIAGRLRDSVQKLHDMAIDVASARQIREFASDRRRNLLSKYLGSDCLPMNQREHIARQNPQYHQEFEQLSEQYKEGEKIIAKWQAEMCRYDGLRSLLSYSRQVFDTLQG